MIFNKKKKNNDLKNELITHHLPVYTTMFCIRMSLEIYLNSYAEDLKTISEKYKIYWDDDKIKDKVGLLFDVCAFTIPATLNEGFKNTEIAEYYTEVFMETEKSEKDKLEDYEYFQKIMDEYKMEIFALYPFLLATNDRPFFKELIADKKLSEISMRAFSFTHDLVIAFCESNPILEGYIGDYITKKAIAENSNTSTGNNMKSEHIDMYEQTIVVCSKCGVKNRIMGYKRNVIAKCGKCGTPLEIADKND